MRRAALRSSGFLVLGVLLVGGCTGDGDSAGDETPTTLPASSTVVAGEDGEAALEGTWHFSVPGLEASGGEIELRLDPLRPGGESGSWVGTGCMGGRDDRLMAPAAVSVTRRESGTFDIAVTATLELDADGEGMSVVQFAGTIDLHGLGIEDDTAGGPDSLVRLPGREPAAWTAAHASLEREKCPPVDPEGSGLYATYNLAAHFDVSDGTQLESTSLGTETNIVSTGVLITLPGSGTLLLEPDTDIFTPWVDFIDMFRFHSDLEGRPVAGEPYRFVLVDVFGEPIEGSEGVDIWERCDLQPPTGLTLEALDDGSLRVSWVPSPDVFGFDPQAGIGIYQLLVLSPAGEMLLGAETDETEHVLPWEDFGGEAPGVPSGISYGSGLEHLEDGTYLIGVGAHANDEDRRYASTACRVENHDEGIFFTKDGEGITVP